jgi:hypothetical protein
MQPCLKVAWEHMLPQELGIYVKLWRTIAVPFFKSAADYMGVMSFLKDAVDNS